MTQPRLLAWLLGNALVMSAVERYSLSLVGKLASWCNGDAADSKVEGAGCQMQPHQDFMCYQAALPTAWQALVESNMSSQYAGHGVHHDVHCPSSRTCTVSNVLCYHQTAVCPSPGWRLEEGWTAHI